MPLCAARVIRLMPNSATPLAVRSFAWNASWCLGPMPWQQSLIFRPRNSSSSTQSPPYPSIGPLHSIYRLRTHATARSHSPLGTSVIRSFCDWQNNVNSGDVPATSGSSRLSILKTFDCAAGSDQFHSDPVTGSRWLMSSAQPPRRHYHLQF